MLGVIAGHDPKDQTSLRAPVPDYAAAVETLVNRKIDLAWFGGFTFVQANVRSGGKMIPVAQREEDERFRSVFITSDPAIKALAGEVWT